MRMKNRFIVGVVFATAVVAGAALVSFAPAANATVYNYNFTSVDGLLTANGQVTVVPNGLNLEVTGITGAVSGTGIESFVGTQTITGIQVNGAFPSVSTSPDGAWYFDSVAYLGNPHLDIDGVVFYTTAAGSWNLYGNSPSNYSLWEWTPAGGYVVQETGNFTASPTPLPSTWLMLLSGFVGLGFFAYRGTKKNAAAIAAA
jgi:hypothetical protein